MPTRSAAGGSRSTGLPTRVCTRTRRDARGGRDAYTSERRRCSTSTPTSGPRRRAEGWAARSSTWLEEETRAPRLPVARTSALTADAAAVTLIDRAGLRADPALLPDGDRPRRGAAGAGRGRRASRSRPLRPARRRPSTPSRRRRSPTTGDTSTASSTSGSAALGAHYWDPSLVYLVRDAAARSSPRRSMRVRFGVGWVDTIGDAEAVARQGPRPRAPAAGVRRALPSGRASRSPSRVDAGNETGATHLYESVGMRVAWQADIYEKRL